MITKYTKRVWLSARLEKWCWTVEYSSDTGRECVDHGSDLTRDEAEKNSSEKMLEWERIDSKK